MDFSATNTLLWEPVIGFGLIAAAIIISITLQRNIPFIRKTMLPTAVLAGFLLLALREFGVIRLDTDFLERTTYHGIAIGFIAMSLRLPVREKHTPSALVGVKSGAVIVGSYLVQGLFGIVVTILLAYTVKPDLFMAAGMLLPMGYGQGPGQANNVGTTFEQLGFTGGCSFGLSIAAAGYLCACIVGVVYLNILRKKRLIRVGTKKNDDDAEVGVFQDPGEIPISQSVDRFSMQIAMVACVYLLTYLVSWGLTSLIGAISPGLAKSVNSVIWGFNFIIGSAIAILVCAIIKKLSAAGIIKRQYQNNYLLNRISGAAFDLMITCGIASIEISDLEGLWMPFIILAVGGAVVTFMWLHWASKKIYKEYYYEGFLSMFGMMTGTISSGVLLLREIDPLFETPAANNLITGSSFAILLGAPMLVLIGLAPQSTTMLFITLGIMVVYWAALAAIILKAKNRTKQNGRNGN